MKMIFGFNLHFREKGFAVDWCAFRLLSTTPTDSSYIEWTPDLEKKLHEVTKNETMNKSQTKHKVSTYSSGSRHLFWYITGCKTSFAAPCKF